MAFTQEKFSAKEASTYAKYSAMTTQERHSAIEMVVAMMSQYESLHAYGQVTDDAITVLRAQGDAIVAGLFLLLADKSELTPEVCGIWAKAHNGRSSLFRIPVVLEKAISAHFQSVYSDAIKNNAALAALVRFVSHPVLRDPATAVAGNRMADACRGQIENLSKQLITAGSADVVAAVVEYYGIRPPGESQTFHWLSKYAASVPDMSHKVNEPLAADALAGGSAPESSPSP
jgi:hypothetical protein